MNNYHLSSSYNAADTKLKAYEALCERISLQPDSLASAAETPTHTTGRLQYIDIAKGIAILAVIIGHAAIRLAGLSHGAATIVAVCFTFHMPLFFLLSGYFLHYERPFNWKKEAKRLVVPCIVAALVIVRLC